MFKRLSIQRFGDHNNAFGFLRLLFASLVIVSHTPELADGDRHRELLTRAFGSISLGDLAVNGFFVVSGFLITASFLKEPVATAYLRKRVARIYPAFAVSSLLCVFIVGPVAGGHFQHGPLFTAASAFGGIALLSPPATITNVFAGTPYAGLNGAAWTIQYEFLCYVLVLCLGTAGLLRSGLLIALAATLLLIDAFIPNVAGEVLNSLPLGNYILIGDRLHFFHLTGLFIAGSAFYLMRDRIPLSRPFALAAFTVACLALFSPRTANIGFAIFAAYSIFGVASFGSGTLFEHINNENDISYGVYLYAWPIEKLLMWWGVSTSLFMVGAMTLAFAVVAGALSWFLVEKPIMRRVAAWSKERVLDQSSLLLRR